jgi:hypothetical protein
MFKMYQLKDFQSGLKPPQKAPQQPITLNLKTGRLQELEVWLKW